MKRPIAGAVVILLVGWCASGASGLNFGIQCAVSTFGFVVPASAGALVCISNMCKGKRSMSAPDRPLTILGMLFPCHGIGHGAEVHRVFNGLPAPTDPSSPDTDNDGLSDSVETGTGIYVSASDTGTDPLNKDTDGGGFGFARSRARLEPER